LLCPLDLPHATPAAVQLPSSISLLRLPPPHPVGIQARLRPLSLPVPPAGPLVTRTRRSKRCSTAAAAPPSTAAVRLPVPAHDPAATSSSSVSPVAGSFATTTLPWMPMVSTSGPDAPVVAMVFHPGGAEMCYPLL
ncbi:unnamed protein product, partial [Urochloa humidicola]